MTKTNEFTKGFVPTLRTLNLRHYANNCKSVSLIELFSSQQTSAAIPRRCLGRKLYRHPRTKSDPFEHHFLSQILSEKSLLRAYGVLPHRLLGQQSFKARKTVNIGQGPGGFQCLPQPTRLTRSQQRPSRICEFLLK